MQTTCVESVEHWPLQRLIPYARNARTHNEVQVSQIAGSIAEFGFVNPILVGDDNVIVAGHGRLMAAQQLGLEQVPVIVLAHLTEAQRKALVIADNKIAENAGWNEELLKLELGEIEELGFDLDVIGFSDDELDELLGSEDDVGLTDDDQVPEPEEQTISQSGDIWLLGDHRLLCGDATNPSDMELLMAGELADMVFTDPPYNVDYGNNAKDKMRGTDRRILNDNLGEGFYGFLQAAIGNLLKVTKGACYIAMSSSELDTLQQAFRDAGGKWSTFIIWAKNTFTLGRSDYQRQYEPILYGWNEGAEHFWCGARDQGDALVSFTFNLGSGALQRSTLRRKLNRQEYRLAAKEFSRWVWAGGKKLKGLIRRRQAEAELFNTISQTLETQNPAAQRLEHRAGP